MPAPEHQADPIERAVVLLLKAERERQGVSTTVLAKRAGINRSTVTHVETGRSRPGFWLVLSLAKGLGVSLAELIVQARKSESN